MLALGDGLGLGVRWILLAPDCSGIECLGASWFGHSGYMKLGVLYLKHLLPLESFVFQGRQPLRYYLGTFSWF